MTKEEFTDMIDDLKEWVTECHTPYICIEISLMNSCKVVMYGDEPMRHAFESMFDDGIRGYGGGFWDRNDKESRLTALDLFHLSITDSGEYKEF